MTKIIGHRGAAGLALENSKASLKTALGYNLDAIEFDVRRTSDGQLVVLHDRHTGRIAEQKVNVNSLSLAELKQLKLKNGQAIVTLEEALAVIGSKKPVVIDIKDSDISEELLHLLDRHPEVRAEFTSFEHSELARIRAARPDSIILVLEHWSPFDIIQTAKRMHATGISLNMWLMNPLTYYLARRSKLELRVYTVNNPIIMRFFQLLYPDVAIYTDHPERFVEKSF